MDISDATTEAQKIIEDLLSFFGLNTVVKASHDEEVISLEVPSSHMNGFLIGSRAETLHSFQAIVIAMLKAKGYEFARVNLDIANYKARRQEKLIEKAQEWVDQVKQSGQNKELRPMNAADRRVVHQFASDNGLETESVGEGRERRIVLKPAAS